MSRPDQDQVDAIYRRAGEADTLEAENDRLLAALTFDGWRAIIASQPGCQDCIFDEAEGGVIDHCHNCCLAIIGMVWRHFQKRGYAIRGRNAGMSARE